MIDSKKTIIQLDKETIVLDELAIADEANTGDKGSVDKGQNRQEIDYGFGIPLIKINSYMVRNLEYFRMDLTGKIPSVIFRFVPEDEAFLYTSYPKDGDLVCLFIRSTSELYKPIRMDLLITEVLNQFSTSKIDDKSYGRGAAFIIKAEMRIPTMYSHVVKAYPNKTSFQTLRAIAKELGLGFASNESDTKDSMTWINPGESYFKFIHDICDSAWKGEEEFFDWWIDQHYVLNFVNIKKQLLDQSTDQTEVLAALGTERGLPGGLDSNHKPDEIKMPLMFTNDGYYKNYPFFVTTYAVKNSSGYIVNNFGYSRKMQFYDTGLVSDKPINKYVKYSVNYQTEKSLGPSSTLFKGRPNENVYQKETKSTWAGTVYRDNIHANYQQASVQNKINRFENFKVYLEAQMHSFIPWVYRGQNVPTRIVHASAVQAKVAAGEGMDKPPTDKEQHVAGRKPDNKFLSGVYMIMGSYIEYIDSKIVQSFLLGKRQWAINDGRASDPEPLVSK
jgi:hypothetical protein